MPPKLYFIRPGTAIWHPRSFPSRQSAMQYEFSSVCSYDQLGKYHQPLKIWVSLGRADIIWVKGEMCLLSEFSFTTSFS